MLAITPYSKDNPVLRGVPDTPAADFVPYGYVYAMVDWGACVTDCGAP